MIAQRYKDMLSGKSVIRQISEWSTARGTEIGYENVFDYSLGNPSVPCPGALYQNLHRSAADQGAGDAAWLQPHADHPHRAQGGGPKA